MENLSTSERLREIMTERKLNAQELYRLLIPYQGLNNITIDLCDLEAYVAGVREPSSRHLYLLADGLGLSELWLLGYDIDKYTRLDNLHYVPTDTQEHVALPIIGTILDPDELITNENIEDFRDAWIEENSTDLLFYLKNKANAFTPQVDKDNYVLAKEETEVTIGDIAVILPDDDNELCLQAITKEDCATYHTSHAESETAPSITTHPSGKIVGKVVKLEIDF